MTDILTKLCAAGARLGDASNRAVATDVPMSAVPQVSQFWSAETADGGRLLTWQDFALGRDANAPVSAQIELMPSGDFIARSNEVERVYRRVNLDDWYFTGDYPTPGGYRVLHKALENYLNHKTERSY